MNKFLYVGAILVACFIGFKAMAATIDATDCTGQSPCKIVWENITNADVTSAERLRAPAYVMFTSGTLATAKFAFQWSHDGVTYNSANSDLVSSGGAAYDATTGLGNYTPCIAVPPGSDAKIVFSSVGTGTQDIGVTLIPVKECP